MNMCEDWCKTKWSDKHHKSGGFVYFLTFLGAAIYYIGQADTFWWGVVAFLKAIVWPVFLILKVFNLLGM